jgi:hypothetical protein
LDSVHFILIKIISDNTRHSCGLVVRVLGYRSGGPDSIPGTTRFSEKKKERKKIVVVLNGVHSTS